MAVGSDGSRIKQICTGLHQPMRVRICELAHSKKWPHLRQHGRIFSVDSLFEPAGDGLSEKYYFRQNNFGHPAVGLKILKNLFFYLHSWVSEVVLSEMRFLKNPVSDRFE